MDELRVFEAFAGYGSQSIALKNIGVKHKVVAISEIDPDAIISYGAIRDLLNYNELPSPDEMKKYLMDRGIGWDFKKGKSSIPRMSKDKLNKLYISSIRTNNLGDISKVNPSEVPDCDLFTYSFPCFTGDTLVLTGNRGYVEIKDIVEGDTVLTHTNTYKKVLASRCTGQKHIFTVKSMGGYEVNCTENHKFYARKKIIKYNGNNKETLFDNPSWVECKNLNSDYYIGMAINQNELLHGLNNEEDVWYGIGCLFREDDTFLSQNKFPYQIIDLPINLLDKFIQGYIGDNYVTEIYMKTKSLAYAFSQLISKVYHIPCKIDRRSKSNSWIVSWDKKETRMAFYDNGFIWFPIEEIIDTERNEFVYDIETEKDHSFMANNCIVHNCTDLSIAGLQKGFDKGSGTSSSLLWECEKIIEVKRPKYLLMENVKMLISQKYKPQFDKWCEILEGMGYTNYYKVLNAKDYGIPQNRERVFMISIHNDTQGFEFPKPIPLTLCLKDLLCDDIEEKYFIDSKHSPRLMKALEEKKLNYDNLTNNGEQKLIAKTIGSRDYDGFKPIYPCLTARDWKDPKTVLEKSNELKLYDNLEGGIYDHEYDYKRRVYETDGISPTHVASNTPKILDDSCP